MALSTSQKEKKSRRKSCGGAVEPSALLASPSGSKKGTGSGAKSEKRPKKDKKSKAQSRKRRSMGDSPLRQTFGFDEPAPKRQR